MVTALLWLLYQLLFHILTPYRRHDVLPSRDSRTCRAPGLPCFALSARPLCTPTALFSSASHRTMLIHTWYRFHIRVQMPFDYIFSPGLVYYVVYLTTLHLAAAASHSRGDSNQKLLRPGDSIDKHHDTPRCNYFSRRLSTASSVRGECWRAEANIRTSEKACRWLHR